MFSEFWYGVSIFIMLDRQISDGIELFGTIIMEQFRMAAIASEWVCEFIM